MCAPQGLAEHATRIADPVGAVDRETDRDRVDQFVIVQPFQRAALVQHPAHVGVADLMAVDRDFNTDGLRHRPTAGQVDDHPAEGLARHLLGGVHGIQDRGLQLVGVDDLACSDPAGDLVTDPADADAGDSGTATHRGHARQQGGSGTVSDAGHETAHLARSDIEGGDQSAALLAEGFLHVRLPLGAATGRTNALDHLGGGTENQLIRQTKIDGVHVGIQNAALPFDHGKTVPGLGRFDLRQLD